MFKRMKCNQIKEATERVRTPSLGTKYQFPDEENHVHYVTQAISGVI